MSIVKITPANEKISCQAGQTAEFQFTLSNASENVLRYGLQIRADGDVGAWLTVEGSMERELEEGGDTTVIVKAAPPKEFVAEGQPAKNVTFRLRVYDASEPEEAVESATVSVEVSPQPKQSSTVPWKWIAVAVLALLLIIGGVVTWVLWPEGRMENYEGKIYSEVNDSLKEQDFDIKITEELSNEKPGYIIKQTPKGGEQLPEKNTDGKRPLQFTVSATSVPNFVGKIYDKTFESNLFLNNFEILLREEPSDQEAGYILEQIPKPGDQLPEKNTDGNRSIQLTVSAVSVLVPNIVGKTIAEAKNDIKDADLEIGEITYRDVTDTNESTSIVLQQSPGSPNGDTRVFPKSKVDIVMSNHVIIIPDVKTFFYKDANATLQDMGLETVPVLRDIGDIDPGIVINTKPIAGQKAKPGSTVQIFVTVDNVLVPRVITKTASRARNILEDLGFKVKYKYSGKLVMSSNDQKVSDQSPSPNSRIELGSEVTITCPRIILSQVNRPDNSFLKSKKFLIPQLKTK